MDRTRTHREMDKRALYVTLNAMTGITPRRFWQVVEKEDLLRALWSGSQEAPKALNLAPELLQRVRRAEPEKFLVAEEDRVRAVGGRIVLYGDPGYPRELMQIVDPPPVLYIAGELCKEDRLALAIVGSRAASSRGRLHAERIASQLAARGLTIVSGLAMGIDTWAHRGALNAGGRTVAVLGCGLDYPYPRHNGELRKRIVRQGALISEFPEYYRWYAQKEFTYNEITQHNRNTLLWRDPAVDGLKTGHTEAAGYCLVASAKNDDMRLITVVMGTPSEKARADSSQALLSYGFRFFETHRLYAAGETIEDTRVWKADKDTVAVGLAQDLYVTIPRGSYKDLKAVMDLQGSLTAPLAARTRVGKVAVTLADKSIAELPLVTLAEVPGGGILRRMTDTVLLWFE